jgi:hypothetical protein
MSEIIHPALRSGPAHLGGGLVIIAVSATLAAVATFALRPLAPTEPPAARAAVGRSTVPVIDRRLKGDRLDQADHVTTPSGAIGSNEHDRAAPGAAAPDDPMLPSQDEVGDGDCVSIVGPMLIPELSGARALTTCTAERDARHAPARRVLASGPILTFAPH